MKPYSQCFICDEYLFGKEHLKMTCWKNKKHNDYISYCCSRKGCAKALMKFVDDRMKADHLFTEEEREEYKQELENQKILLASLPE